MKKKLLSIILLIFTMAALFSCKKEEPIVYSGSVRIYTSLSAEEVQNLKEEFENKYKGIVLDYFYGETDTIKGMIDEELDLGQVEADVIFMGTFADMDDYKADGVIKAYESKSAKKIKDEYKDSESFYVGVSVPGDRMVPIALINNALNEDNGKYLIDFILEKYSE